MSDTDHDKAQAAQQPEPDQAPPPASQQMQPDPEAVKREVNARFRNSRGGQVVLDPESDASLGARGGGGGSIEENTLVRDQHLVANSMDPRDPDASHLPANVVPPGGPIMDQVDDEHEPAFKPDPEVAQGLRDAVVKP